MSAQPIEPIASVKTAPTAAPAPTQPAPKPASGGARPAAHAPAPARAAATPAATASLTPIPASVPAADQATYLHLLKIYNGNVSAALAALHAIEASKTNG